MRHHERRLNNMLLVDQVPAGSPRTATSENKLRPEDRSVHHWYRFVLSFPPHLVRDYLDRFGVKPGDTVLDPFCGTGTTLVECKKLGVGSVGVESNPIAHFASSVKVDWTVDGEALAPQANEVAAGARKELAGCRHRDPELLSSAGPDGAASLFTEIAVADDATSGLRRLGPEQMKLLLKNSISPLPLHKTLVLLEAIDGCGWPPLRQFGRLALANALVQRIGNLKFGPEVGVGRIRGDAPVVESWVTGMKMMAHDLARVKNRSEVFSRVIPSDARQVGQAAAAHSIDAVITSPPYPN